MTTTANADIVDRFPALFQGLGNLGEPYDIQIKPEAKPYSLFTPCHISLPLRPQVKAELDQMEAEGIISQVDVPTPWCAGMAIALKKNGSIHICVDFKPLNANLNANVIREVHPLPTVDEN